LLGSFLAARDKQHDQIEELAVERFVPRRNDTLDDEQFACGQHRTMAIAKYRQTLFLVPIVDDVPQNVRIRPGWYGFEKAAGDELATIQQARRLNPLLRTLDDMREIEENALHPLVFLEDFRHLGTVAAANVRNDTDPGEIVRVENGARFPAMNTDHGCIEDAGLVGMFAQIIENRLAENFVEGNLSGATAVLDLCPGTKLLVPGHERQGTF